MMIATADCFTGIIEKWYYFSRGVVMDLFIIYILYSWDLFFISLENYYSIFVIIIN